MKPEGFENLKVIGEEQKEDFWLESKCSGTIESDLEYFKRRLYESLRIPQEYKIKEVDHVMVNIKPEPTCSLIVLKSKIAAQKAEKEKD